MMFTKFQDIFAELAGRGAKKRISIWVSSRLSTIRQNFLQWQRL